MATRNENLNRIRNAMGSYSPGIKNITQMNGPRYEETSRDESLRILQNALIGGTAAQGGTGSTAAQPEITQPEITQPPVHSTSSGAVAPPSPQGEGLVAQGTGRSAEQVQQEIADSRKELARLQSDAAYILTAEPGAELGRQMDEERARIEALEGELNSLQPSEKKKTNVSDLILGTAEQGAGQVVQGVTGALDWLFGDLAQEIWSLGGQTINTVAGNKPIVGETTNPITAANEWVQETNRREAEYYAKNAEGNKAAELVNKYGPSVVAAIPQAVIAVMTSGASAATTAGLEAASSAAQAGTGLQQLASMVANSLGSLSKNPSTQAAFIQASGSSYNEAIADGASKDEAELYALINGTYNTLVEMGGLDEALGGMQSLPKQVREALEKGNKNVVLQYVRNIASEAGEEVIQGMGERGLKTIYTDDVPVYSPENPNAIINPAQMAEEAKGGAIVSTILGTGQLAAQSAISARENANAHTETQAHTGQEQTAAGDATTQPAVYANTPINPAEQATEQWETAVQQVASQEERAQMEAERENNREQEVVAAVEKATERYFAFTNDITADRSDPNFWEKAGELWNEVKKAKRALNNLYDEITGTKFDLDEDFATAVSPTYAEEPTTPQSAAPTAPLTRGATESAPLNVQQEAQAQAAETAQEAQRATPQAETPPTTQNAAQAASGELNTQTETNTQGQGTSGQPTAEAFTPTVRPGSVAQTGGVAGEGGIGGEIPQGAKISKFWSNTLQKVEEAANVPKSGRTDPLWYMPKSEAQSLAEAASRLESDRQGTIETLVNAEAWSGVQTDAAASVASELYAEARKTGNWASVAAWDKVMQNHSTETGRGIQALAKYTRTGAGIATDGISIIQDSSLSPEQKTAAQNKIAQFGDNLDDALADKDISGLRELILRMNDQRGTGTFVKGNFAKVLDKIEDVEYLGEYARRQLSAVASDYTASESRSIGEVLKTWQINSQLTSLGTFFRNIGGNITFGSIDSFSQNGFAYALDSLVSKKTGKRTVAADKGWFSSEARKQAIDAMNRSILEVAGDVDMGGNATRYGTTSGRTFKMSGGKAERFMSRWEQLLGYSLQTSDRLSRGQIEGAVQTGLEGLKNSGLSAEEISQIAESTADYRLFQNEGTAAKLSKGAHDVLNILGIGGQVNGVTRQGGFGVGDLVNPYPKVPANLGVKALEYSPANIIKGGIELVNVLKSAKNKTLDGAKQHQAVMDISRGFAGTPIIMLCAAMLKTGLIKNFDDEEDYDVQAQNAAEGKTGVQINLDAALRAFNGESTAWRDGDDLMSISWTEPLNAFLAIGSLFASEDDDATISTYIGDYFNGALQSVLDMPLMSNLSGAIDTVRYSTAESLGGQLAEGALDYAVSTATGFIPAPFRQSARAIDPYYRNTAGDSKVGQAVNKLINAIPGLRQTLDPKLDNFGQPKENAGGFAQRALNALVLPGAITELNQSDASAAVEAIYEATGDAAVYPDRKAPNSISSGKNKHSLTADEKQNYQKEAGQTSSTLISSLAESKYYDRMSDEQKAEVVKAINLYAEHKAADQIFDILGIDTKRDKWETLKGNDLISYLSVKELVSGMYDDDGKITDYSAADKLIGQIKSGYGNLSAEAKGILKSSYGMLDDLIYGQENGVGTKEIYTAKEKADVNGNGSITQEELWNYLETQVIMPSSKKSVLWDILTSGKTGYSEYAEKHK